MKLLNALINGSTDAIFIANVQTGMLSYANKAACNMTGYSFMELCSMHQLQLHPEEENSDVREKFQKCVSTDDFVEVEVNLKRKDGSIIPVKVTKANLFEEDGVLYAAAYFKDISVHKEMKEIAFIQSHIVRAPLANIIGLTELILSEEDPVTIKDLTSLIREQSDKLDSIVKDIVTKTEFKF